MAELPAHVKFGTNADSFEIDQHDDVVRCIQMFRDNDGEVTITFNGSTTLVTPQGSRQTGQGFEQISKTKFDDKNGFTWQVTRVVYDQSPTAEKAATFQVSGNEHNVSKFQMLGIPYAGLES
jgi:hypothetical protein